MPECTGAPWPQWLFGDTRVLALVDQHDDVRVAQCAPLSAEQRVILLAPPFGRLRPIVSLRAGASHSIQGLIQPRQDRIQALITSLVAARVGGAFWAERKHPKFDHSVTVLCPGSLAEGLAMAAWAKKHADTEKVTVLLPDRDWGRRFTEYCLARRWQPLVGAMEPWSVIDAASTLHVGGDDALGFLGLLADRVVHCWSPGAFSGSGITTDHFRGEAFRPRTLEELAHATLLTGIRYRNPFNGQPAQCEEIIEILADWRRVTDANRQLIGCAGIAWWKRRAISRLLHTGVHKPRFFRTAQDVKHAAGSQDGAVALWPSRAPQGLAAAAVKTATIEDGFLRSVGLGSNLTPPCSVVVDQRGVHFDPEHPSDLEILLSAHEFSTTELERAQRLIDLLVNRGISKYNTGSQAADLSGAGDHRVVLVAGQVEDDLAFRKANGGVSSNLHLLARTRAVEPNSYIVFKPHPDVEAGHRRGAWPDSEILKCADQIARGVSLPALLRRIDAIHVVSSLSGFEALLRNCEVFVHGQPFYAGWGLTRDFNPPPRRARCLTLAQLVAGALILYPRYVDPVTGLPCRPELLVERLTELETRWMKARSPLRWLRKLEGRTRNALRTVNVREAHL